MNKKSQEEMVGLVLIMLVVAVVFLVFLGIYFSRSNSPQSTESAEISQFLETVFEYSTSCGESQSSPVKVRRLITRCYEGQLCPEGDNPCEVLQSTLKEIIESSWNFGANSPQQGYQLSVIKETESGEKTVFPPSLPASIVGGSPSSRIRAAEQPLSDGIIMRLEIYSAES